MELRRPIKISEVKKMKKAALLLFLCLVIGVYAPVASGAEGKLTIGLLPGADTVTQLARYAPLCKYLGNKMDMKVEVKPLANYGIIHEDLRDGKIDAGFFGSLVYGQTRARIGIEPLARLVDLEGNSTYSSYTFVRSDRGIKSPKDIKGKNMAVADPASTGGYPAQRIYFQKYGMDIDKDVKIIWATDHDAAVMLVFDKLAEMGGAKNIAFDKAAAKYPAIKRDLVVLDKSPEVPDTVFAVRKNLDPAVREKLRSVLIKMDSDPEGKKILTEFGARGFIKTKDEDYKNLYTMVKEAGIDLKTYPYKKK